MTTDRRPVAPGRRPWCRAWCNGGVPWCDTCDRFLSPSTVHSRRHLSHVRSHRRPGTGARAGPEACDRTATPATPAEPGPCCNVYGEPIDVDDDEKLPLPWHLKLLAGALAVYLGYRFLQGIEWVLGK